MKKFYNRVAWYEIRASDKEIVLFYYPLTLFILMDFPAHIDIMSMDLTILYFKGSQLKFLNSSIFLSLKFFFI